MTDEKGSGGERCDGAGSSRALVAALGVLALVVGGGFVVWVGSGVVNWRLFVSERDAVEATVESWESQCPANIPPAHWEAAWQTVYNALGNVCFSPDHVSVGQLQRLRADVEQRNAEPITLDTLAWLWARLARTGKHGNEYIRRMQPLWDDAVAGIGAIEQRE